MDFSNYDSFEADGDPNNQEFSNLDPILDENLNMCKAEQVK